MPGLNELKNDGNEGRFFASATPDNSTELVQPMSTNSMPATAVREKADFSSLPKSERETVGVEQKVSPVAEIFKQGGDFDQYLKDKREEFDAYQREAELAEAVADGKEDIELEVETPEDILGEKFDINETMKFDIGAMSREQVQQLMQQNNTPKVTPVANNNVIRPVEVPVREVVQQQVYNGPTIQPDIVDTVSTVTPAQESIAEIPVEGFVPQPTLTTTVIKEPVVKEESTIAEDTMIPDVEITRESITAEEGTSVVEEDEIEAEDAKSEDTEATDENERLELLKSMITEKIKPVSKKLDVSGFTIAKKGTTAEVAPLRQIPVAKWVLPATGITFNIKEILGSELEKMRSAINSGDDRSVLQIIYDHIVSPKPDFNKWMHSIAFDDYDHLFFGIYIAAFADSNYLPIDCEGKKCTKKTYITDNVPVGQMIKYKSEEAKAKIAKLMKESPVEMYGLRPTEVVPISESIAIGFINPSLYSRIIEPKYFNDEFYQKYATTISLLPFIDNMYTIDWNNKRFVPIEWKEYVNNEGRTLKSRVVRYDKIISTMPSDQLAIIRAYIGELSKNSTDITYQMPETTCPHCGHVNPANENQSATALVFLRNQLGLLVNI